MASTLSPSAIHQIFSLVVAAPTGKSTKYVVAYKLSRVNSTWKAIHLLYMLIKPAPPLEYLGSLELALVFKGVVDDENVRAIFAHGKPLQFWGCPRLLVSKIVEAFRELPGEPTYLDVTITAISRLGATRPSEAWSEIYTSHLPCHACSTVEAIEERRDSSEWYPSPKGSTQTVNFVVQKFHVSSRRFGKGLIVELHYKLTKRGTTESEPSSDVYKITIRLADRTCLDRGRLSGSANRLSATLMLNRDIAPEVFGFLDRAHVRSSLLANRALYDLLCQLKQRLPVHHLTCAFEAVVPNSGLEESLAVRHRQRDLSYTDVRRFDLPSSAGAEVDCALIRHHLSNSHLADVRTGGADFSFVFKMLASLAARNVSVDHVQLCAAAKRLSDFRSTDAVFGGMRMTELHLRCDEHRFVELVKITDFFRMPTIQGLRKLRLSLASFTQ